MIVTQTWAVPPQPQGIHRTHCRLCKWHIQGAWGHRALAHKSSCCTSHHQQQLNVSTHNMPAVVGRHALMPVIVCITLGFGRGAERQGRGRHQSSPGGVSRAQPAAGSAAARAAVAFSGDCSNSIPIKPENWPAAGCQSAAFRCNPSKLAVVDRCCGGLRSSWRCQMTSSSGRGDIAAPVAMQAPLEEHHWTSHPLKQSEQTARGRVSRAPGKSSAAHTRR